MKSIWGPVPAIIAVGGGLCALYDAPTPAAIYLSTAFIILEIRRARP